MLGPHGARGASGTLVQPGVEVEVASLSYSGTQEGRVRGRLVLLTNSTETPRVVIPYHARVLHGEVAYDPAQATFDLSAHAEDAGAPELVNRLVLTNRFSVPLRLLTAKVSDALFAVGDFASGTEVAPGEAAPAIALQYHGGRATGDAELRIDTDLAPLTIPLKAFDRKLRLEVHAGDGARPAAGGSLGHKNPLVMDFGVLGVGDTRSQTLAVVNPNPVPVKLAALTSTVPHTAVRLEAVHAPDGAPGDAPGKAVKPRKDGSLVLEPGHRAEYSVALTAKAEEDGAGFLEVRYRGGAEVTARIPLHFSAIQGSLAITPATIKFDPAFPGKRSVQALFAKSTYSRAVQIKEIASTDPRIVPYVTATRLEPNRRTQIGQLVFDPARAPPEDNYMSDAQFAGGAGLTPHDAHTAALSPLDAQALRRRRLIWDSLVARGLHEVSHSVTLRTDIVEGFVLPVKAALLNPRVVVEQRVTFNLTHVGQSDLKYIHLQNPSDSPVTVYMDQPHRLLNGSTHDYEIQAEDLVDNVGQVERGQRVFAKGLQVGGQLRGVWHGTMPPGGGMALGPIEFMPKAEQNYHGLVFLRNNLTKCEKVVLTGMGGSGNLDFLEYNASSSSLPTPAEPSAGLVFRLGREDLGLDDVKTAWDGNRLTRATWRPKAVQKRLIAVNNGKLPMRVENLEVRAVSWQADNPVFDLAPFLGLLLREALFGAATPTELCASGGFAFGNCEGFTLQPGEARNLDFAFTPDCSTSSKTVMLLAYSPIEGRERRFVLNAEVPPELLPVCSELLLETFNAEHRGTWAACVAAALVLWAVAAWRALPVLARHLLANAAATTPAAAAGAKFWGLFRKSERRRRVTEPAEAARGRAEGALGAGAGQAAPAAAALAKPEAAAKAAAGKRAGNHLERAPAALAKPAPAPAAPSAKKAAKVAAAKALDGGAVAVLPPSAKKKAKKKGGVGAEAAGKKAGGAPKAAAAAAAEVADREPWIKVAKAAPGGGGRSPGVQFPPIQGSQPVKVLRSRSEAEAAAAASQAELTGVPGLPAEASLAAVGLPEPAAPEKPTGASFAAGKPEKKEVARQLLSTPPGRSPGRAAGRHSATSFSASLEEVKGAPAAAAAAVGRHASAPAAGAFAVPGPPFSEFGDDGFPRAPAPVAAGGAWGLAKAAPAAPAAATASPGQRSAWGRPAALAAEGPGHDGKVDSPQSASHGGPFGGGHGGAALSQMRTQSTLRPDYQAQLPLAPPSQPPPPEVPEAVYSIWQDYGLGNVKAQDEHHDHPGSVREEPPPPVSAAAGSLAEAGQHLPASLATQLWGTSDDPAPPPQSLFGDSLWGSQAAPPPAPPPASDANGSSGSISSARFDSLWATSLRSESSGASGASGASGSMFASTADSLWSMPTARGEQAAFQPLPARKAEGTASMFSGDQWPTSTSGGRRGSDPTNNADDDDADPVKRSYSFF